MNLDIALGAIVSGFIGWIMFIGYRTCYRMGKDKGYTNGYKDARKEYRDIVMKLTLKNIKIEGELRDIKNEKKDTTQI